MSGHFVVGFLNRDVEKEYQKLDGSQRRLVRIAVAKLKTRADEIGTPLHGELAGCKRLNGGMRDSEWFSESERTEWLRLPRLWQ